MVGEGLHGGMGLRLLLDTHALYWWLTSPHELSRRAYEAIEDPANDAFVSSASIYELTFKVAIGKLRLAVDLARELTSAGFEQLPLTWEHAYAAAALPLHHRDPWDRLLAAQTR